MKINNKKFALLLSGVLAAVYIACSIFVALFSGVSIKLMTSLFHVSSNVAAGNRVIADGIILGVVQVLAYSYVAGLIFAWVFNRSMEK